MILRTARSVDGAENGEVRSKIALNKFSILGIIFVETGGPLALKEALRFEINVLARVA